MTMATVVPMKGSSGMFAVDKALDLMIECGSGCGDVIVKTDQEPAIEYLVKDIVEARGDEKGSRTIVEESPVKSKGNNGVVERAVQTIEGQIRVMKLALEWRLKRKVEAAGSSMDRVLKCTCFLTDAGDFKTMNALFGEFFPEQPPARSTVVIKALVVEGARVEIDCIAAL